MSLFSIFDPVVGGLGLGWVSLGLVFLVLPVGFWVCSARSGAFWVNTVQALEGEFSVLLGGGSSVGVMFFVVGLFGFILVNNVGGLVSYIFVGTSHIVVSLSMVLPLWVGLMVYGWLCQAFYMFVHLVPQGTPMMLSVFMVLIESISLFIRPFTLAVRLGANMIAGHLLLVLLGSQASGFMMSLLGVSGGLILLLILETAVAVIQAYVFVILLVLYFGEMK